jgi:hypothetical protein
MLLPKLILLLFALYLFIAGLVMLFAPHRARRTLQKAGSTNFINYAEITLRMIPALAFIFYAEESRFPVFFSVFGWVMLVTSLVLYFVPRKLHHEFSLKSAEILTPLRWQLFSPLAFLMAGLVVYGVF